MKFSLIVAAALMASPALADEVGVRVGPVGAGVTVGETHHDHDRTIVREHEPSERTTVIKKKEYDEPRSKTIIKEHRD